jgi:hypothetical protein
MKPALFVLAAALAMPIASVHAESRSYVGVISESMCKVDHKAMKISPDEKCIRDCVKMAKNVKYVLLVDKDSYLLSDQQTPAAFAGRKVRVTGTVHPASKVLAVEKIEAAK